MDQIKIGKFIASLRKEKGLTQMMLADRLGISDKTVSKWERGAGLPDVSLMLPLCETLEISVNELLTGEKLTDADYKKKAEVTIMNLVQENKENKKRLYIKPEYRGKGYARLLINTMLDRCRKRGFREVVFTTKPSVMNIGYGLYQRMGFQEVSNDKGTVTMRMSLG